MRGLDNDVYLTVVSVCKGYKRRKKIIDIQNERGESDRIKRKAEALNLIITESINENCCEWIADDMIDCIADMIGFRKYKRNHLISKYSYDRYKRDSVIAIAKRLELI